MPNFYLRCFVAMSASYLFTTTSSAQSTTRSTIPGRVIQSAPMQGQIIQSAPPIQGRVIQSAPMQTQGSSTRAAQPPSTQGSNSRSQMASVGLEGYCPVCIVKMKKWVKGSPAFQASYDGKTYLFPGEEQRQMFLADPAKYAPAIGGDCSVCLAEMGKRMPGSIYHSAINDNRLFLFPNAELKQKFVSNPNKYNQADLAEGGNCVVCRVEMNEAMAGSPEVFSIHNGMRYQFASDKQRQMFLANPSKYTAN